MSDLVIVVFDIAEEAGKVCASLKGVEHEDKRSLDESEVAVKDENGTLRVKQQVDRGARIAAVTGSLIRAPLASVFCRCRLTAV